MPESDFIENPYPNPPGLWVGKRYADETNDLCRTLVLGESTYDRPRPTDPEWILYWINKEQETEDENPDNTFSRLHWVMHPTASRTGETRNELYRRTSSAQLEEWFNLFGFQNFIWKSIGKRENRHNIDRLYVAAQPDLHGVTRKIKPRFVWVLWPRSGVRNASVAINVLESCGIDPANIVVMPDFAAYVSYDQLIASWKQLRERVQNANKDVAD